MGLRGCVDAWGEPVKREGFIRPSLTEPAKHGTNNSPKPVTGTINNSPKLTSGTNNSPTPVKASGVDEVILAPAVARGRGRPKATDSARPWIAAGLSRSAYYRQVKAKDKA